MSEGKRLFVGVRVSTGTANQLAGAAETLARRARDAGLDIRWVAPVNYHLTLKFLGWTRDAAIAAVRDALEAAAEGLGRLTFKTARLGAFPSLDKASVVWAGIDDRERALGELAAKIDAACERLGYAAEARPFHAHVTLGRLKGDRNSWRPIRDVVLPLSEQMFGDTRMDAISLFESETKSSGSVYRELGRIAFKTASEAGFRGSERQTPALQLDATNRSSEPETDDGWPRGQGPNHGIGSTDPNDL